MIPVRWQKLLGVCLVWGRGEPQLPSENQKKERGREGSPDQAFPASITLPGTLEKACIMNWSFLPDDMVSHILGKLSLFELARIASTCSHFRAFFCEKMAQEQEARHQLAVDSFGSERIACLCALIVRVLKGAPLGLKVMNCTTNQYFISADGVLHGRETSPRLFAADITIRLKEGHYSQVLVKARDSGVYWLMVVIYHQVKCTVIDVRDAEGVKPAALMQALLSGGLAKAIPDLGFQAEIGISGSDAKIVPLLPFASRYVPKNTTAGAFVRNRILIGVDVE